VILKVNKFKRKVLRVFQIRKIKDKINQRIKVDSKNLLIFKKINYQQQVNLGKNLNTILNNHKKNKKLNQKLINDKINLIIVINVKFRINRIES